MKHLLVLIIFITGCKSNNSDAQQFVKVSPENGTMELMIVSGELGYSGTTETYFLYAIKERDIDFKKGFVVVKLNRTGSPFQKDDPAYKLLDSLNECKRSFNMVIDGVNNWSDEYKATCRKMRELEYPVRMRFYDHVKVYIEKKSLNSGVSNEAYLKYE